VSAASGLDFTSDHGLQQREMIEKIGTSGRAVVGTGVAGSGKTVLLQPLIEAWHEDGRKTIGVTLAWRQTGGLKEAGVQQAMALARFLHPAVVPNLNLDAKTVVVIDEIAQVGTKQVLDLARLQAQYGFQIAGLGDDKQCQSIEAGSTVRLFQKSLGTDQVPELLNTIRQRAERDRETTMLFRDGKAAEALERKDQDGEHGTSSQAATGKP
jgi:ATP-dependent exoDNAse (exonuclease V) alpha subunit